MKSLRLLLQLLRSLHPEELNVRGHTRHLMVCFNPR